jgi:gamma-butyrobetaine dioxygenase
MEPLRDEHAARILRIFEARGHNSYFGEAVSQTEHALQSAWLAAQSGAPDHLVMAALLHDIGHLLHGLPDDIAEKGIDDRHEVAGHEWLARHFGPEVAGPVRLHVNAKRYLCRVDADYLAALSPGSRRSLELQGGPYSEEEARSFESSPHFEHAVWLRRWDDQAKIVGLDVPPLSAYLSPQ